MIEAEAARAPSLRVKIILAYAAVYVFWGSSYFALRLLVQEIPPPYVAGTRYCIAGLSLLLFCLLRGDSLPKGREWHAPIVVALFLLILTNGTTTLACAIIPSSVVAILQALGPCWTILLDSLFFHKQPHGARHFFGVAMGIVGVALLVLARSEGQFSFQISPIGICLVVAGAGFWALGSLIGKDIEGPPSSLMGTAVAMTIAGPVFFLIGISVSDVPPSILLQLSTKAIWGLAYLILFSSQIAFCAHYWLMRVEPPSRVSTSTFVNPLVAMFLGVTFAGEVLTAQMLAGTAIILLSVTAVWRR